MPNEDTYTLCIDVFTPSTIPMQRLAEYMKDFAALLDHKEYVHFDKLQSGSLKIRAVIDPPAQSKVYRNVEEIRLGGGPKQAREARDRIDEKLAEDNAVGHIQHGDNTVIDFPGRNRHVESELGPIDEPGAIDGEVVEIGGRDETINVYLRTEGRNYQRCITSREVARQLAQHLWGPPVRVEGKARWVRMESGVWQLKRFEILSFHCLDETPLTKLFENLRSSLPPPAEGRLNPVELVRQLREE
jgi:hypothetical protein